jgi:hypothetical protein
MSTQAVLSPSGSATAFTPNYSRIRFQKPDDIERLYPLLTSYVRSPPRAKNVSEIVIDLGYWSYFSFSVFPHEEQVQEMVVDENIRDEFHIQLQDYVRGLDFDDNTTTRFIQSLDWKHRQMTGAWQGPGSKRKRENFQFGITAIVLLLSLCDNISTLYLGESLCQKPILDYMVKGNYREIKNSPLQNLKNVRFITSYISDERNYGRIEILEYIQLIHRLPALESVAMDAIQEYQADRVFFIPGTGNIKRMEITHCDISGEFLATMISIPKALEELKLSIGGLWSRDGGGPLIRPFHVGIALSAYKDSLRVLDIDIDNVGNDTGEYGWDPTEEDNLDIDEEERNWLMNRQLDKYGRNRITMDKAISTAIEKSPMKDYGRTIGSLHDFPRLTHLSISIMTLLGSYGNWQTPFRLLKTAPFRLVDGLPPSLEHLCIYGYVRGDNPDVDGHIDELLSKKAEKLPRLKVIKGVYEHVQGLKDIFDGYCLDEQDLYVRKEFDLGWKVMDEPGRI